MCPFWAFLLIQEDLVGDTRKKPAKSTGKAKKAAIKATRASKQEKRAAKNRPAAVRPEE